MSRRVTLPGADELFRATGSGSAGADPALGELAARPLAVAPALHSEQQPVPLHEAEAAPDQRSTGVRQTRPRPQRGADRRPSGRERHDEKITVYLSPDELIDLERARLTLRQDHGMAVDRGRIVR
jgi:hypothetical protein